MGLDISDVSLKLVQFEKHPGGLAIQAYSEMEMPKEVISGDVIKNPKLLVELIKKAIARPRFGKITTKYAVASIPETKSFVRVIQMPVVSEEEAREAVPWEAEAYIPMPMGQVYLDWMILKSSAQPAPGTSDSPKMTVLITAAPRDYVDDFTAILKEAGLSPLALEVESQATARSLVSNPSETVMICDIDTVRTSLIIYERETLQFTSSIPIAGNVFTESIARALGVDSAKAEQIKREFGLDESHENGTARKAMVPVINNLVTEIKNTIRFYEEHGGPDAKISRLLLSGGSGKLKHLPSFLLQQLNKADESHSFRSLPGIKVELGNPWVKVLGIKQVPPLSREDSLSFSTAIGLALRDEE